MDEKFTWSLTWWTMDKVSWSSEFFCQAYLQAQILGDHEIFNVFLARQILGQIP